MFRFLPLILVVAVMVAACGSDSTTNPDDTTSSKNSFNVTGGGYTNASFKGYNNDTAGVASESGGSGLVTFAGKTSVTNEVFTISLLTPGTTAGTYPVSSSDGSSITLVITNGSSARTYFAGSGTIEIKSWGPSGRTSGTFSGVLVDPVNPAVGQLQVTAGKFDVDIE